MYISNIGECDGFNEAIIETGALLCVTSLAVHRFRFDLSFCCENVAGSRDFNALKMSKNGRFKMPKMPREIKKCTAKTIVLKSLTRA